ncbi:MAG TPA: cytochrome c [Burkholderiaceae bacterium]
MSSRFSERRAAWLVLAFGCAAMLAACEREKRDFDPPQGKAQAPRTRNTEFQPGDPAPVAPPAAPAEPDTPYTVEGNAYAVSQGKRLYRWYNCSACHAPGGGGDWGPALSDAKWIYGSRPEDIYASIVQGRPAGMPSFGAHIPQDQVWDLVAYVRSLSGQLRIDVAPGRSDGMAPREPETRRTQEIPTPQVIDDGTR